MEIIRWRIYRGATRLAALEPAAVLAANKQKTSGEGDKDEDGDEEAKHFRV